MKVFGYCPICEIEIKVKTDKKIFIKYCPCCKHHLAYKENRDEQKTKKEIS